MVCFLGNSKQDSERKDSELEILRIEMEPSDQELEKKLSLLKAGTVSELYNNYYVCVTYQGSGGLELSFPHKPSKPHSFLAIMQ